MYTKHFLVWTSVCLMACPTNPGAAVISSARDAECADLVPDACATDSQCSTIIGRNLHDNGDGGTCIDWDEDPVAVGCQNSDSGCAGVETWAAPAYPDTAGCMWFSSSCIPDGWNVCDWELSDDECPASDTGASGTDTGASGTDTGASGTDTGASGTDTGGSDTGTKPGPACGVDDLVFSAEMRDASGTAGTEFTLSDDLVAAGVVTNPCEDDISLVTPSVCLVFSGVIVGDSSGSAWYRACLLEPTKWEVPATGSIQVTEMLGMHTLGEYTLTINFIYPGTPPPGLAPTSVFTVSR